MPISRRDVRDKSLKKALGKALKDRRLSYDEVGDLIQSTLDGGAITKVEREDLKKILDNSASMDKESKRMLKRFIRMANQFAKTHGAVRSSGKRADKKIFEFMRRDGAGRFPNIDRFEVGMGLLMNVRDPNMIYQGNTSLCGPASILRAYAKDFPLRYATYVTDLYDKGQAKLGSLTVKPSDDCRRYNPPRKTSGGRVYRAVDWIATASLRDSENYLHDYQNVGDEFAGITGPGELTDLLKSVGYTDVKSEYERWRLLTKASAGLVDKANRLKSQGYHVFLLINDQLLYANKVENSSQVARHWVMLTSNKITTTPSVSFEIYNWGRGKDRIPATRMAKSGGSKAVKKVTLDMLREHLFGVVGAKR